MTGVGKATLEAQIDDLREYASRADGTFPMLASALRDAADTIWQLRDDLQRANDAVRDAEHDESMAWDRVRKTETENAKLRELCGDLFKGFECGWPSDVCGDCKRDGIGMPIGGCKLENRALELGVEVDA